MDSAKVGVAILIGSQKLPHPGLCFELYVVILIGSLLNINPTVNILNQVRVVIPHRFSKNMEVRNDKNVRSSCYPSGSLKNNENLLISWKDLLLSLIGSLKRRCRKGFPLSLQGCYPS